MKYIVAVHHREGFDAAVDEGQAIEQAIDVLNDEMIAKGARVLGIGLKPPSEAKSLRTQPGGDILITDGPYLETKEHVAGFWILEATNMDEALEWGRKAVKACRANIEVRAFQERSEVENEF